MYLDGKPFDQVASIVIEHPQLGTLTYGETPLGYDSWSFHEHGGGGSVTLPFIVVEDGLFVGVVRQLRPNQGGEVWNAPRGFLDPGEDRAFGAARELAEEVGLPAATSRVFPLPGQPGNPNSTFFETWAEGEGVTFFGMEVDPALAIRVEGGFCFKPGVLDESEMARRSRLAEAIGEVLFVPWYDAAQMGDLNTNAAVVRLLVHLRHRGQVRVVNKP